MRGLSCVVLLLAVNAISSVPLTDEYDSSKHVYPRFINFPDGEGNIHVVDLEEPVDQELIDAVTRDPANNRYLLYTRRNPTVSQELFLNNAASVQNSNFNPSLNTVVVAHGWLSNSNTDLNPVIRDAYLGREDCNVIILDWRRLALSGYVTAANGVPAVGRGLGQFMSFLTTVGANFNNMHLVGFSLGAHLVGNAGRQVGGRIPRVTGLDPAGPLWNLNRDRLQSGDGVYTEAIHTDGGYTVGGLGIGTDIVQVDFFPNGGISQPGCLTNICNHNRAWELFAATVTYNHLVGNECTSNLQISLNTCRGQNLHMGNGQWSKSGSGMYRLDTARRYPF